MTMFSRQILIVDDEKKICNILSRLLQMEGFETIVAYDGLVAQKFIQTKMPDVMLVDFNMPGMNGMELLKHVKKMDPGLPVIMITGYADVPGAVEAIKAGAHDYISKPFKNHEVIRVVHRALAERDLKQKIFHLSSQLQENYSLREMMGPSDAVDRLISIVNRVAKSDFTVVIQGETGTGKELIAHAIHQASARSKCSFVPVDCGAIPSALLESELFGYERGAFTDAKVQKPGKFEIAQDGTLFLDEIANMPLGSQAKLLRALQEKNIYRVGGNKPLKVDVRLLTSCNTNLEAEVQSGSFRQDLFYRLNEFTINIPPLLKRGDDVLYLADRFLGITNVELNKHVKGFTESALDALLTYSWPGNVRQLRSTIRRAVLLADELVDENHIGIKELGSSALFKSSEPVGIPWKGLSLKEIVRQNINNVERSVLQNALRFTGGNKAKAARLLRIDYKTMHTKVKQLGISIDGETT